MHLILVFIYIMYSPCRPYEGHIMWKQTSQHWINYAPPRSVKGQKWSVTWRDVTSGQADNGHFLPNSPPRYTQSTVWLCVCRGGWSVWPSPMAFKSTSSLTPDPFDCRSVSSRACGISHKDTCNTPLVRFHRVTPSSSNTINSYSDRKSELEEVLRSFHLKRNSSQNAT